MIRRAVPLALALLTAGCVTIGPIERPVAPSRGLVCGSLVLEGGTIDTLTAWGPGSPLPSKHHLRVYPDGTFFLENLEPGTYTISGFTAHNQGYALLGKDEALNRRFTVKLAPGAIAWVGAFRAGGEEYGFTGAKFRVDPVSRPGRAEVLRRILKHTAGTGWDARVRRAIE